MDIILQPGRDHIYSLAQVVEERVVFNPEYNMYSEYVGDEYLERGDRVVKMKVVR